MDVKYLRGASLSTRTFSVWVGGQSESSKISMMFSGLPERYLAEFARLDQASAMEGQ